MWSILLDHFKPACLADLDGRGVLPSLLHRPLHASTARMHPSHMPVNFVSSRGQLIIKHSFLSWSSLESHLVLCSSGTSVLYKHGCAARDPTQVLLWFESIASVKTAFSN